MKIVGDVCFYSNVSNVFYSGSMNVIKSETPTPNISVMVKPRQWSTRTINKKLNLINRKLEDFVLTKIGGVEEYTIAELQKIAESHGLDASGLKVKDYTPWTKWELPVNVGIEAMDYVPTFSSLIKSARKLHESDGKFTRDKLIKEASSHAYALKPPVEAMVNYLTSEANFFTRDNDNLSVSKDYQAELFRLDKALSQADWVYMKGGRGYWRVIPARTDENIIYVLSGKGVGVKKEGAESTKDRMDIPQGPVLSELHTALGEECDPIGGFSESKAITEYDTGLLGHENGVRSTIPAGIFSIGKINALSRNGSSKNVDLSVFLKYLPVTSVLVSDVLDQTASGNEYLNSAWKGDKNNYFLSLLFENAMSLRKMCDLNLSHGVIGPLNETADFRLTDWETGKVGDLNGLYHDLDLNFWTLSAMHDRYKPIDAKSFRSARGSKSPTGSWISWFTSLYLGDKLTCNELKTLNRYVDMLVGLYYETLDEPNPEVKVPRFYPIRQRFNRHIGLTLDDSEPLIPLWDNPAESEMGGSSYHELKKILVKGRKEAPLLQTAIHDIQDKVDEKWVEVIKYPGNREILKDLSIDSSIES